MTDQMRKDFEDAAKPLIKFLNDYGNPHMTVIVDPTSAVLYGGEQAFNTDEFIKD